MGRRAVSLLLVGGIILSVLLRPPHAAGAGTWTMGGLTFPAATNGCGTDPSATHVGIYGSSALQGFILAAAADYCSTFADKTTAPDVEYAAGGDSCPGIDYAADNSDGSVIGASSVFPGACAGLLYRSPSLITDTQIGVDAVVAIAQCPGATTPQGGGVNVPGGTPRPCLGYQQGNTTSQCGALNSATYPLPDNVSHLNAQIALSDGAGNWSAVGGCATSPNPSNAASSLFTQQRVSGSGARITYCFSVFGPGQDAKCMTNIRPDAKGTDDMVGDICGNLTTLAGPLDPLGTLGYVSRSALVLDPTAPNGTMRTLNNCGYIQLNGKDAYNRNCDPVQLASGTVQPYSGINTESNLPTCSGDLQVVDGEYTAWSFLHLDLNAASTTNQEAQDFIVFVAAAEDLLLQQQGFLLLCQMEVTRGGDGQPYALTSGATC